MKFCPECGKEWNGSKFCAECGKDLRNYISGESEPKQAPDVKEEMAFSADFDFLGEIDNLAQKAEAECKRMADEEWTKCKTAGNIVKFGNYPYSEQGEKEPIEWIVLAVESDRALLITKNGVDCQKYNDVENAVTWETCTLRKWLNSTFLNSAFSAEEQHKILTTSLRNEINRLRIEAKDRIFLLSIFEANTYVAKWNAMHCSPTPYFKVNCGSKVGIHGVWWWLRSTTHRQNCAAAVDYTGHISYAGNYVNDDFIAVRPALWINLKS